MERTEIGMTVKVSHMECTKSRHKNLDQLLHFKNVDPFVRPHPLVQRQRIWTSSR
jgi:hypothetical protein